MARELKDAEKPAVGTPWVPCNLRPIPRPAEEREILELAA